MSALPPRALSRSLSSCRPAAAFVLLVLMLALPGCSSIYRWNQKVSMVVDTPAGPVEGSSIQEIEVTYYNAIIRIIPYTFESRWRGEATVVEFAPGRFLIALPPPDIVVARIFTPSGDYSGSFFATVPRQVDKGRFDLMSRFEPLVITFDDTDDPTTARAVHPRDLARSLGPGYALRELTVEIVREPTRIGRVDAALPWLKDYLAELRLPWTTRSGEEKIWTIARSSLVREEHGY